jgi:hypothetical protein
MLVIDVPGRGPPGEIVHVLPRRTGEPGLELRACYLTEAIRMGQ